MRNDPKILLRRAIDRQQLRMRDLRGKHDPETLMEMAKVSATLLAFNSVMEALNDNATPLRDFI